MPVKRKRDLVRNASWTRERICAIRQNMLWTQQEFANKCNVTLRCVQWWESGERQPNGSAVIVLEQIEKVATPRGEARRAAKATRDAEVVEDALRRAQEGSA